MPANHCIPHTPEAKAKMSAARKGKAAPWKHRETRDVDGEVHYRCGRCSGFFPRSGFHANRRTLLGIKSECKPCHTATTVRSRDPVKKRAAGVLAEASRRARKAGSYSGVTAADWREVLRILGSACLCCGSKAPPTQDHVVPLSRGGAHHPLNLQPLCRPCNERKQAREFDYRSEEQRATVAAAVWAITFKRITP